MEVWGFIWLMFLLKIPVVALLWLVWWAVHQKPEPIRVDDGEGGSGRPQTPEPRGGPPRPRKRGPHGDPTPPAPPRARTPARARDRAAR